MKSIPSCILALILAIPVAAAPAPTSSTLTEAPAAAAAARHATASAGPAVPGGEIVSGELGAEMDLFMTRLSRVGFSGAVLVANDGVILLKKGYGLANRERHIAIESETIFEVGSLAKIFTAAAVLRLESEGRIGLDDPVQKYVGALSGERAGATIHQLLLHTAGLFNSNSELDYSSRAAFLRSVRQTEGEGVPGETFRYSNAGYTLLAAIVEEVSGMTFDTYLETNLFKPSGMRSSGFAWDDGLPTDRMATGYAGETHDSFTPVSPSLDIWGTRGASGVITNVGDLYRWIQALDSGTVLPAASLNKMFTAYVGDAGYGWQVVDDSSLGHLVRRGGSLPAFDSSIRWYRDTDLVIIFTLNSNRGFRIRATKGITEILAPHVELR